MHRIEVNVETGAVTQIELTPEEIAEIEAYVPPPQPIPQQVPMWAVRTVLAAHDIFDEANAAITVSDNAALKNIWEYGNYAVRSSAAIASLAAALGLTDEQVDAFFIEADALLV